jgi:hypothetical protein
MPPDPDQPILRNRGLTQAAAAKDVARRRETGLTTASGTSSSPRPRTA